MWVGAGLVFDLFVQYQVCLSHCKQNKSDGSASQGEGHVCAHACSRCTQATTMVTVVEGVPLCARWQSDSKVMGTKIRIGVPILQAVLHRHKVHLHSHLQDQGPRYT